MALKEENWKVTAGSARVQGSMSVCVSVCVRMYARMCVHMDVYLYLKDQRDPNVLGERESLQNI